jgi:hypothetical protein
LVNRNTLQLSPWSHGNIDSLATGAITMPVVFDADVSGYGSGALSTVGQLAFGLTRIVTLGPGVSRFDPPDGTHVRGLGWFSPGVNSDDGSGAAEYFLTPRFITLDKELWNFGTVTTDSSLKWGPYSDYVRWWITPGSTVHLYLYVFD